MAKSTRARPRTQKKRVPAPAAKKAVTKKKTAVRKQVAGSPGGAKRNPGTTDRLPRVPLRSTRATGSGKKNPVAAKKPNSRSRVSLHSTRATSRKKPVAAKPERAPIRLDGRRLSRRIEFTGRLTEHIRQRYVEAGDSPAVIARSVGVAKATIQRLVKEQAWTRAETGPRDLSRAEQLEAQAHALAKKVSAGRATDAGATLPPRSGALTLPPRSGGEGRRTLRQQGEPGWGDLAKSTTASGAEALLPPTPDPSPPFAARTGGGDEDAAPPGQDAAPSAQDAALNRQDGPSEQEAVDVGEQIERLLRGVSAEIGVYENLRAQLGSEPQAQREAQKTAHHLASLTSTLDTLRRMRAGQTAMVSDDTDDFPADIDAFRDELARRIDAFVASRTHAGDAGDGAAGGADEV